MFGQGWDCQVGYAGTTGGVGFYATSGIKVTNNGRIAGGGGGGGGGKGGREYDGGDYSGYWPNIGGGGGGGIGNGSGGPATVTSQGSSGAGGSGSLTAYGAGGTKFINGGEGGSGGTYGSSGSYGQNGPTTYPYPCSWCCIGGPFSGGGAGAAVVGTSNITWNATGTRNGAIS